MIFIYMNEASTNIDSTNKSLFEGNDSFSTTCEGRLIHTKRSQKLVKSDLKSVYDLKGAM